ncbi:hypothetical protein Srufu_029610 [Streptomyces libani subsp. rufus]|nr:hypothetical protein Srufu_029610 [Streptomyces libani subsp. rufus]
MRGQQVARPAVTHDGQRLRQVDRLRGPLGQALEDLPPEGGQGDGTDAVLELGGGPQTAELSVLEQRAHVQRVTTRGGVARDAERRIGVRSLPHRLRQSLHVRDTERPQADRVAVRRVEELGEQRIGPVLLGGRGDDHHQDRAGAAAPEEADQPAE